MSKAVQRRGGTTVEHSSFAGLAREITVDTTKKTLVVHDGVTAGGNPLATEKATNLTDTLTVNTNALVVNSSKSIGAGTLPSNNWKTSNVSIEIGGTGALVYEPETAALEMVSNAINSTTGWTLKNANYANILRVSPAGFSWLSAPSGTAGSAITSFVQKMTLTPSGNLLVGTSTDDGNKLQVAGAVMADQYCKTDIDGYLCYANKSLAPAGNYGLFYSSTSPSLQLWTAGMERARIDSSGNLLVGMTSGTMHRLFKSNNSAHVLQLTNGGATYPGGLLITYSGVVGGVGSDFITCQDAGNRFVVLGSGNVQNINNSYGAISDIKLKCNIEDARGYLTDLCKVQIKKYNFKSEPTAPKQIGVIAQELEQIFPGMIEETPDKDADGNDLGTVTKAVKYSVFVPMLIKAVQELKAEIDVLKGVTP